MQAAYHEGDSGGPINEGAVDFHYYVTRWGGERAGTFPGFGAHF